MGPHFHMTCVKKSYQLCWFASIFTATLGPQALASDVALPPEAVQTRRQGAPCKSTGMCEAGLDHQLGAEMDSSVSQVPPLNYTAWG